MIFEVIQIITEQVNNFLDEIRLKKTVLAEIYTHEASNSIDRETPVNMMINYVIKPRIKITNIDQYNLNVDTVAGKSINAIRSFTGKGILIWGSRVLARNDNEWRYVPVRQLLPKYKLLGCFLINNCPLSKFYF